MRMEARSWQFASLAVMTVLLGAGCTQGGDEPSPAGAEDSSGTSDAADEIARSSEQIDIGGRSLHLECWGEQVAGEPTVLLITGQGPTTSSWELMASEFAADGHHLCSYDRAGVGASDPAPEASRTTKDQVTDLVALLDAADLQEPVILAAHSLGSLPAVGLVARAPERVAGVVLVDPLSPRVGAAQRAALPPEKPDESRELAEERRFQAETLRPVPEPRAPPPGGELRGGGDAARRARADLRGPPGRRAPAATPSAPAGSASQLPRGDRWRPSTTVTGSSPPNQRTAHSSRSKTRATTSRTTNRRSSWMPSATSWPDSQGAPVPLEAAQTRGATSSRGVGVSARAGRQSRVSMAP